MFQEEYKKAYDEIMPDSDCVGRILAQAAARAGKYNVDFADRKAEKQQKIFRVVRPVAVAVLALCLCCKTVLPVMAQHIPAVYHVIEKYVPGLMDFILPQEVSSTSKGITLQVEAIELADDTAEILLSFRDAEGSNKDLIQGRVDLYDSFYLHNFGENWSAGGASFLEYDANEDKAYFKVQLQSSDAYSKNRVRLGVRQILTQFVREERKIDMSKLLTTPQKKQVSLSGSSGMGECADFPFFSTENGVDDPRPQCNVMDIAEPTESMLTDLVVTGVAYEEGVLRVQSCRGNFTDADRHLRPYLKDAAGNERPNDYSVGWQEEINGERVLFDEHWFLISEEELANYELYGMFYITDGSVKGKWEVTFKVE